MKSYSLRLALFVLLCPLLSWYSWLLGYATGPTNSGINPLGALVSALLVSSFSGWASLKAYVRRIIRVRTRWTTYAIAVLLPLALAVLTVVLLPLFGVAYSWDAPRNDWKDVVDAFLIMFLFVALGEEPAWRGWLLPFFRARLRPLGAALAVAPLWAVWHLPMWGRQLPYDQLAPFLVSLIAGCVVLSWLTNRTRGGVLPAMLCHASINAFGSAWLFNSVDPANKTEMWWIVAVLWGLAAAAVVLLTRGHLGDDASSEPTISETRAVPAHP
jgi:membrane protease YdiL (CAAX protease family)